MKPKSKKAPVPQLDLKDPPAIETQAEAPKTEAKTFRSATLTTGRRSLFRDLREGETG